MDALPPPPPPGGGGGGGADDGPGRGGKAHSPGAAAPPQPVLDVFGGDLHAAGLVLILVVLGLVSQAMTRCVCT
jgi:hypothetical protein